MSRRADHWSSTLVLLLTLFFLAGPFGKCLVMAQPVAYKAGDIVEVRWIDKWVIAKVDKCLNANTCMVYLYDASTGGYATNAGAMSTDHIRATARRPPAQPAGAVRDNGGPVAAPVATTALPDAALSATSSACSFDPPGTSVSRTAPASGPLFQRVIYDWYALDVKEGGTTSPLKVGVTFVDFQMGKSFANRVFVDPGTGAQRMHDGAPEGATIYPVKTKQVYCRAYRGEILRQVVRLDYACFKDKFGDWGCPSDSVRQILETKSIPTRR